MQRQRSALAVAMLTGAIWAQTPIQSSVPATAPAAAATSSTAPVAATPSGTASSSVPAPAKAATAASPSSSGTSGSAPAAAPVPGTTPAPAGDEGFQFHPGLTFGTVTMNGQTWTRLSFTPEISFGKLGVGFNVELFLDQNQNLSTRGWDFDNRQNAVESILRKIDYVRWDHPGAPFYARLGTLEGIDLGYGLVASGYGNMARYPDYKELGADIQLNDMTNVGLDLEVIVNNLQDVQNGGPFTAFKVGARPFKPVGIPLLDGLAFHAGVAYDWNQYAGLRDQDGDGCPDAVDYAPNDASTCVPPASSGQVYGTDTGSSLTKGQYDRRANAYERAESDSLRRNYSARKPFAVYWLDAKLPVITTTFLGLELHSALARPRVQDPAAIATGAGWGAIPLGVGSHIGPVTLTADYRIYDQPFQPGYFDALYEIQRAQFVEGRVLTKELAIYGQDAQRGVMQGYFAGASWDVFGFARLGADYSDLFPSRSGSDELRAAGAKAGIGPQVASILQQKISLAEVYWRKDRIGLDTWTVGGVEYRDSFLGRSTYTVYGYRVGSQVAPGLTLIVDRQTSFTRQADGSLSKDNQMRIETQLKF